MNLTNGMYIRHSIQANPYFWKDTIRRFCANVSELKQMAARNFEDFLQLTSPWMFQCAMPVFQGLLAEPYNSQILRLLFHLRIGMD
ncbi:hypothetical protein Hypma_014644 [Hypsizygus marmoreus]|uniref:Uncharacterized protein n=1 Tax=Hypsizygus marmoreus TaxID=39966 RepID=A0A369JE89_HYPMA|nr:hypothetical protein Hypma_014644 [Hypsizygus marmoreus]